MTDSTPLPDIKLKAIEALFADLPQDYPEAQIQLERIHRAVQESMAHYLEPRLNQYLQKQNPQTLEQYRQLANVADANLTKLGLNIKADGKPALLIGELSNQHTPDVARYALIVPLGRTRTKHAEISGAPPPLHLVASDPGTNESLQRIRRQFNRGREL